MYGARRGSIFICDCVSRISDEILDVLSDTEERAPTKESPILIIDDDSDFEGPVLIIDEDSCDEGQSTSQEKEMEVFDISQHSSPHDAAEPDLGENLDQPPSGAEATVELEDEEPAPVVEQPRKRKSKTKNICVTPGKPLISRRSDLLNAPSPPCAPALPALPLPLPLDLPVCSAQPVLPTNLVPSQRHPSG